jgi:hypothetical protein
MIDLDFDHVPRDVVRLAVSLMIDGGTLQQLMKRTSEDAATYGASIGLSYEAFLSAVDWATTYYEQHPPLGVRAN